ncbi:MAG: glycosyltransferase family 2 protein [Thermodesulfobacteriota bacterium]
MSKIVALRPNRDPIRPVLMLTASHRIDSTLLSLRSLERFTNLARFKHIYVLADSVSPDQAAILYRFMHTRDNVDVVHCSGNGPVLAAVRDELLNRHLDDVIVTMADDVFVTPLWLEHLLEGYRVHAASKDIPIVSALSPVSPDGRFALNRFLKNEYPAERAMFDGEAVEQNWVYHRWMWEKVANGGFMESWLASNPQPYFYPGFASLGCAAFDRRLIKALEPLQPDGSDWQQGQDAAPVNAIMRVGNWKNAVVSRSVAHHYAFSTCEDYLRSHVPLDMVWQHLQEIWRQEQIKAKTVSVRRLRPVMGMAAAGR